MKREFIYDPYLALYLPLWKRDAANGQSFMSDDAYGHLCTVTGATWGVQGRYFDGTDDNIDLGDKDIFSFGNATKDTPFSVFAWINRDTPPGHTVIISKKNNNVGVANGFEWMFWITSLHKLGVYLYDATNGNRISRVYNTALGTGSWMLVGFTYDGLSLAGGLKLYLNGKRVDDTDDSVGVYVAMHNSAASLKIGCSVSAAPANESFFKGTMESIHIVGRELFPGEIQRIYLAH